MFGGGNKIKLDKDLLERIKVISKAAGYASHEEFIVHVLEKEIAKDLFATLGRERLTR